MARPHDESARWRRPYEKAAAGEARDGRGESMWDEAGNSACGRGMRSERRGQGMRSGPSIRTDDRFVALPLKDSAWWNFGTTLTMVN
jgi:hypothetical protein